MKQFIQDVISELKAKGNSISQTLTQNILGLNVAHQDASDAQTESQPKQQIESFVSNPERPWYIAGGVLVATSALGLITSIGLRPLPYLTGAVGLAMLGWGFYTSSDKQTPSKPLCNSSSKEHASIDLVKTKLDFLNKIDGFVESAQKDWENYMEGVKSNVQNHIYGSSLSEEEKGNANSYTYDYEKFSLNTLSIQKSFNNSSSIDDVTNALKEYANKVASEIKEAVEKQAAKYNKIIA